MLQHGLRHGFDVVGRHVVALSHQRVGASELHQRERAARARTYLQLRRRTSRVDKGDDVFLRDLRSTNGTYVAGRRVLAAKLNDSAEFRIGSSALRIDIASL